MRSVMAFFGSITGNKPMTIDIRRYSEPVQHRDIVFTEKDKGGNGMAYRVTDDFPVQCGIESRSGKVHVKYEDIDNLVRALQLAKQMWGRT